MTEKKKIAVVLMNTGGPSGNGSVRPFLFNYFLDKNITSVLCPSVRLATALIKSFFRRDKVAASCDITGGCSPILENTLTVAAELEQNMQSYDNDVRVFVCMRYWHPMADSVAPQVQAFKPDNVVVIPLCPQFSSVMTRSMMQKWKTACRKIRFAVPTSYICCYPEDEGYIRAVAENINPVLSAAEKFSEENGAPKPLVVFSASGASACIVRKGDPFTFQCEKTVAAIADEMKLKPSDYALGYDSGVCFCSTRSPRTSDITAKASAEKRPVVVVPFSSVCDDTETAVRMAVYMKNEAESSGCPFFAVTPVCGLHSGFIGTLAGIVRRFSGKAGVFSIHPECVQECSRANKLCCHLIPDMLGDFEESDCPACLLLQKMGWKV